MPDSQTIVLDNTLLSLLTVFLIIFLMLVSKRLFSNYIAGQLYRIIQSKWKSVSRVDFTNLLVKPLGWFLFSVVAVIALDSLKFPAVWNINIYGRRTDQLMHDIGNTLMIVLFIRLITRFIDFFALIMENNISQPEEKKDNQVIVFFRDFFKVIIYIIGVLLVLNTLFKVDIGSFLTGLSIVGAALALAAKESIENLIASFIIFFDKPFFTGDFIKVNSVQGEVEHIGLRSTRIRTQDHSLITIPNKQMVDGVVDNLTNRNGRRAEWKLELSHENSLDNINQFMSDVKDFLASTDTSVVSQSNIHLTDINKNGIILLIEIHFGLTDIKIFNEEKQKLLMQIKQRMEVFNLKTARGSQEITIISEGRVGSPTTE